MLVATVDLPDQPTLQTWLPMPSKVPWHALDLDAWQSKELDFPGFDPQSDDSSQYLHRLGAAYEDSFSQCFQADAPDRLPGACRGRGQIYQPKQRAHQMPKRGWQVSSASATPVAYAQRS